MAGEAFGAPGVLRYTVTPTGEVVAALRALAGRKKRAVKTATPSTRASRSTAVKRRASAKRAARPVKRSVRPKKRTAAPTAKKRKGSLTPKSRASSTRKGGRR